MVVRHNQGLEVNGANQHAVIFFSELHGVFASFFFCRSRLCAKLIKESTPQQALDRPFLVAVVAHCDEYHFLGRRQKC